MPYKDTTKQKSFQRQWHEERKRAVQAVIAEARIVGCQQCGEMDPACLDFHHLNPEEKSFNVGGLKGGLHNPEKVREEIAKCVVLCANCHRKLHAGRFHLVVQR